MLPNVFKSDLSGRRGCAAQRIARGSIGALPVPAEIRPTVLADMARILRAAAQERGAGGVDDLCRAGYRMPVALALGDAAAALLTARARGEQEAA